MEEPKDETLDITNENATGQASDTKDVIAEAKRLSRRRTKTGCLSASNIFIHYSHTDTTQPVESGVSNVERSTL